MKNYITGRSKPFYGWFVVFLAFLALNTYGVFYSYSAFITPLEAELQTNRAGISGAYTTFLAVYSLFAIPMGWLADRYGPRRMLWLAALLIGGGFVLSSTITSLWQLYLLFGVMAGIGHGAIFVVPTSTVSRWFAQRRGLALGMAVCGVGTGLLVLPPIAARLIEAYSWQTTFIFLGVVAFIINVVVGALIKGKP
ncbi:MAG: MFS transporter, partial [Chloroflexota bacterium]|nr:MFS transporter [Chloroflexota bacterium]